MLVQQSDEHGIERIDTLPSVEGLRGGKGREEERRGEKRKGEERLYDVFDLFSSLELSENYDIICDALFGFSFKVDPQNPQPIRAPYDQAVKKMVSLFFFFFSSFIFSF